MKELPPPPSVWTPPPERWFERHEHPLNPRMADNAKTLTAMRLTVYDRMSLERPEARNFTHAEGELLSRLSEKFGLTLMAIWRTACIYRLKKGEDPEMAFLNLLKAMAFLNLLKAKGLADERN